MIYKVSGEAAGDRFGAAVALSDDGMTFAVGAPDHDYKLPGSSMFIPW